MDEEDLLAKVRSVVDKAGQEVGGVEDALSKGAYAMLSVLEGVRGRGGEGLGGGTLAKGMLVQGPGGVGKSAMVEAMLRAAEHEVVRGHAAELFSAIE